VRRLVRRPQQHRPPTEQPGQDDQCRVEHRDAEDQHRDDAADEPGRVHDLPGLYAALDAVVLTSRNEGTPVALIEAMAAGPPVVATRVGGVSDVIEDGRTGLMAPAADAAAVAASISSILEAPNLARNLVRRGREASARFGLERLADELTDL
jgi:glycosyltransferase involved in cell wall biosynthesis